MKKSRGLTLPEYDYNESFIEDEDNIIDLADIFKTRPGEIAESVRKAHEDALKRKMENK